MGKNICLGFLLLLLMAGCSRRDWVKPADVPTQAYSCFIFIQTGGQNLNCSGDVVIGEGRFFRGRLYDNVLGQKLGELEFQLNGTSWLAVASEKTVYYQRDNGTAALFCGVLPSWLEGRALPERTGIWKIIPQGLENNPFDSIIMESGDRQFRARIAAKTDAGLPRRFQFALGKADVVLDIAGRSDQTYLPETNGYQARFLPEGGDLFSMIGDRYVR